MSYQNIRASAPQRWNIPVPSRWSRYWSYVESVPYQLQTWWRNAKRRVQWRKFRTVECDSCGLWQLAYRCKPVVMRNGATEQHCKDCVKASDICFIVFHTQREQ